VSDVKVRVEHDGYNWIGIVHGGGTTQAKNLDRLKANVVEVVRLMHDRTITEDDVHLDVVSPVGEPEAPAVLQRLRTERELIDRVIYSDTYWMVVRLKDRGFPMRDISHVVGLSHQRVAQLLKEPEPPAEVDPALASRVRATAFVDTIVVNEPKKKRGKSDQSPRRAATACS
jgi:hypothetical protein